MARAVLAPITLGVSWPFFGDAREYFESNRDDDVLSEAINE